MSNKKFETDSIHENYRLYSVSEDGKVRVYISNTKATQAEIDEFYNALIMLNRSIRRNPKVDD